MPFTILHVKIKMIRRTRTHNFAHMHSSASEPGDYVCQRDSFEIWNACWLYCCHQYKFQGIKLSADKITPAIYFTLKWSFISHDCTFFGGLPYCRFYYYVWQCSSALELTYFFQNFFQQFYSSSNKNLYWSLNTYLSSKLLYYWFTYNLVYVLILDNNKQ